VPAGCCASADASRAETPSNARRPIESLVSWFISLGQIEESNEQTGCGDPLHGEAQIGFECLGLLSDLMGERRDGIALNHEVAAMQAGLDRAGQLPRFAEGQPDLVGCRSLFDLPEMMFAPQ